MEDSTIKAKYVYYCENAEVNKGLYKNVSELSKYIENYNYGDLIALSDYRDTGTYIIGKEGKLIPNPDYSASGYLTIPYEITKHLTNAVDKYKDVDFNLSHIDLRYDDKFIKDNINTTSSKILEKWNWKLTLKGNYLGVVFPNGTSNGFNVEETSAYIIKKWYEGSKKEQSKYKLYYKLENEDYDLFKQKYDYSSKPNIPSTWTIEYNGGGGSYKKTEENQTLYGPKEDEEKMLKAVGKFYNGFNYSITKVTE